MSPVTLDLRLVPLAVACWFGAFVGTSGWSPDTKTFAPLLAAAGFVAVVAIRARRPLVVAAVLVLALTSTFTLARSAQRHDSALTQLAEARPVANVEVVLSTEPVARSEVVVATAELQRTEARGGVVVGAAPVTIIASGAAAEALAALDNGARYLMTVRLAPARLDDASAALLSLRTVTAKTGDPGVAQGVANGLRAGLRRAVSHSPPQQAALVPSLVVGDTSGVDEAMRADFQATGLTHLMAVSGANLTLLLAVVLALARGVGVRGWWVRIVALLGVGGFILVCGQEASVLRAAAMGIVALAALGAGRGARSLRNLSLAVLGLCWWDPWLARSAGFGLSVAACAGIVVLGPVFRDALAKWAPRWLADALSVSLAAQLATQPLVTAISSQVSVVGVLANVLAAPFVGPTTVLGLLAAVLSGIGWLAVVPGWLAGWCAQPILWLAEGGAALPSAAYHWPVDPLSILLVSLIVAVLAFVLAIGLRHWTGGVALLTVLIVGCLVRPVQLGWPGQWAIAFCDVGQGDATVLRAGERTAVVVDAGPEAKPTLACLASLRVQTVPLLVLTHYHADHTGGAESLIRKYRPALILARQGEAPRWLQTAAEEVGAELRAAVPGETLNIAAVTWTTVTVGESPSGEDETQVEGSLENDASVVAVASAYGVRVLLAGDLEPLGQARALRAAAEHGISLSADVLKLPHHGSARQDPRFFQASGSVLAVVSAGAGNDYGHPAQAALDLCEQQGMAVARTDQQGTIAVLVESGRLFTRTLS